jgi:hypothetical protein
MAGRSESSVSMRIQHLSELYHSAHEAAVRGWAQLLPEALEEISRTAKKNE